jgi:hypothetical protein
LTVKQFLAQKSVTEMEHLPFFPDLAPNGFWLFPKIKGRRFQDTEDKRKSDEVTDNYSTTGVPKMYAAVAASLG